MPKYRVRLVRDVIERQFVEVGLEADSPREAADEVLEMAKGSLPLVEDNWGRDGSDPKLGDAELDTVDGKKVPEEYPFYFTPALDKEGDQWFSIPVDYQGRELLVRGMVIAVASPTEVHLCIDRGDDEGQSIEADPYDLEDFLPEDETLEDLLKDGRLVKTLEEAVPAFAEEEAESSEDASE
jgi:hypothetical protein